MTVLFRNLGKSSDLAKRRRLQVFREQLDLDVQGEVEIRIRADRTVIWVSTKEGTVARLCQISNLTIIEEGTTIEEEK